jgi:hypothetical protein
MFPIGRNMSSSVFTFCRPIRQKVRMNALWLESQCPQDAQSSMQNGEEIAKVRRS